MLPFDAHNHVHLGPTVPLRALLASNGVINDASPAALSGMAVMSTHPRDFHKVISLSRELVVQRPSVRVVPCFGVHPWFVSELKESDWMESSKDSVPQWIADMEVLLMAHPDSIVGEIGLDGFHFDFESGDLVAPMEKQVEVFRLQMELATTLRRPVSIHTVQCFGVLMDVLSTLKTKLRRLPPKIYFHAFGGKQGTVDQLLAICGRELGQVFFGFAPVISKFFVEVDLQYIVLRFLTDACQSRRLSITENKRRSSENRNRPLGA
jgi:Tat protein secretion system quality control protein TatD with DNase activity